MASHQSHNISHKAGEAIGQAQMKKDELMNQASNATQQSRNTHDQPDNNQNASITAQATTFIQHTGEQMKSMAQGAAEAVKSTLGMNENTTNTNDTNSPCNTPGNPCNNPTNRTNNPINMASNKPTNMTSNNSNNNPRII